MGAVIHPADQPTLPEPLGDEPEAVSARMIARARNFQLALDHHRGDLTRLALCMAERFVRRSLSLSPDLIDEIYNGALQTCRSAHGGVVRVHPEAPRRDVLESLCRQSGFRIEEDTAIDPIGCVLESGNVRVDATLDTAMRQFEKALSFGSDH